MVLRSSVCRARRRAACVLIVLNVALYGIHFDTDKSDLEPESQPV
jgi:hypothetical protein